MGDGRGGHGDGGGSGIMVEWWSWTCCLGSGGGAGDEHDVLTHLSSGLGSELILGGESDLGVLCGHDERSIEERPEGARLRMDYEQARLYLWMP